MLQIKRWEVWQYLTLMLMALTIAPAVADDAKASKAKAAILTCLEQQTSLSICTKPCSTWAQSQPEFQYSFDACVANCRKEKPCVGR